MLSKEDLYSRLESIGFRVITPHGRLSSPSDIENTLIQACYHIDEDGRLLGLLMTWIKIHGDHIIADKFFKEYEKAKRYLGETPWVSAVCAFRYTLKDHRFKKGVIKQSPPHSFGHRDQSTIVKLKGSVDFLEEIGITVPQTALRMRIQDVLSVGELVNSNRQYRNRYLYGANWRSEIITAIQNGASNPGEIARLLGIARSRVGIVFKEYMLVKESAS